MYKVLSIHLSKNIFYFVFITIIINVLIVYISIIKIILYADSEHVKYDLLNVESNILYAHTHTYIHTHLLEYKTVSYLHLHSVSFTQHSSDTAQFTYMVFIQLCKCVWGVANAV